MKSKQAVHNTFHVCSIIITSLRLSASSIVMVWASGPTTASLVSLLSRVITPGDVPILVATVLPSNLIIFREVTSYMTRVESHEQENILVDDEVNTIPDTAPR